jgi:hypothetical protein
MCGSGVRYEPYLVLPTRGLPVGLWTPAYDERFAGYGKNKIQFVQHVRYSHIMHVPVVSPKHTVAPSIHQTAIN